MLRITTTIKVDGTLAGDVVTELARVCADASVPRLIDLSGLLSADAEGTKLLRRLRRRGFQLTGARPYLAMLLDEADDTDDRTTTTRKDPTQ